MVESAVIKNMKKSPNFPSSVLFVKVVRHHYVISMGQMLMIIFSVKSELLPNLTLI